MMMNLSSVEVIIDKLQSLINNKNCSSEKLTITIVWNEGGVIVESNSNENSTIFIEKEYFDSKTDFLRELINSIKKFSLLNINASIRVYDSESTNGCPLYEAKNCDKFFEKVIEYTGLKKFMFFDLILPIYEAEIYFFVRSENLDENLGRLIITSDSFNSTLVNTLYVKMMSASDFLQNIFFIGKINNSDHQIWNKIIDSIMRNLMAHLGVQKCTEDSVNVIELAVIDLTSGHIEEDHKKINKIDDEIFYELNTSDIMEIDFPIDHFYDPEIKGLRDGWDAKVDAERYKNVLYDEKLMAKFLNCLLHNDNEKPIVILDDDQKSKEPTVDKKLKRSKSDDDLQIVSVVSTSKSYGRYSGNWNLRERSNVKTEHPVLTKLSSEHFRSENRPNKIKSNLFDDEDVVKWEKSRGSNDMSKLLASTSENYKSLSECLDKDYKIPRKSYNGPTSRPPIHSSTKDSKILKQEPKPNMIKFFQKRVENLTPYDSPSSHQTTESHTPESVSKFFDAETIHVIDDDDENNNNNTSSSANDKVLKKIPAKRRLLPISPKMFKNRRTDYNFYDSPFSSNVSRNSSSRRKL